MVYTRNQGRDTSHYYSNPIDRPAVYIENNAYEYGDDAERTPRFSDTPLISSIYEEPNRP